MIALDWYRSAEACLEEHHGEDDLFIVSHGQIDLADWVVAAHREFGRAAGISVWTFALSRNADLYRGFLSLEVGDVFRVVMSSSQQELRGHMVARWLECNPKLELRIAKTHAKIARVWLGDWRFLVHGSGNASGGARTIEQWQISRDPDPEVWRMLEELELSLPEVGVPHRVAVAASGLGLSEAKRQFAKKTDLKSLEVRKWRG